MYISVSDWSLDNWSVGSDDVCSLMDEWSGGSGDRWYSLTEDLRGSSDRCLLMKIENDK